jgi:hypothetical protein
LSIHAAASHFVLCAPFENTKEKFKIYLENALNYWKIKKKKDLFLFSKFGPVQQKPASAPPFPPARVACRSLSRDRLGQAQQAAAGPVSHARLLSFSFRR